MTDLEKVRRIIRKAQKKGWTIRPGSWGYVRLSSDGRRFRDSHWDLHLQGVVPPCCCPMGAVLLEKGNAEAVKAFKKSKWNDKATQHNSVMVRFAAYALRWSIDKTLGFMSGFDWPESPVSRQETSFMKGRALGQKIRNEIDGKGTQ